MMRKKFAELVHSEMEKNKSVWVITGDLGYKMWDDCFLDFPDRCINVGASEQSMIGIATGLAWSGKTVFAYSITNFLIYRPFEWIRNYLAIGQAPVKLIASGRDRDYESDGITHWSDDAKAILSPFSRSIVQYWPENEEVIGKVFRETLMNNRPTFISLRRE
jgi:transketolase